MPDITETQVREFIALKLPDASEIEATAHRDVENKIMDFVVQEIAKAAKTKVLILESFATDRNYTVSTGLPSVAVIDSVVVMLVCKVVNNGYSVDDEVTAPTPTKYGPNGVGVQYNNSSNNIIKIMTSDELVIMAGYNATPGAISNNISITGVDTAKWSLKLIVGYK